MQDGYLVISFVDFVNTTFIVIGSVHNIRRTRYQFDEQISLEIGDEMMRKQMLFNIVVFTLTIN